MYELVQLAENSYYIQSPAKMGLVLLNDTDVCLIDSGNDKEAGRKVRQILDANNWHLKAIFNTHSNADHIGGNKYLQDQTGCKIYAVGIDCDFTRHPVLEPSFLYGGFPPKDLKHKFLMAQPSDAEYLTNAVLPTGFKIINLPGHFFDMVGFRNADDVVYLADCLSSKETLEKYQISFVYDVASYINTLEMVKELEAKVFVPAHVSATFENNLLLWERI
jgi:Zn-dependent hydrolases, including glyoxylases